MWQHAESQALINCGATSIYISPSLHRKIESPHEPAFTSTQGLNGQVMMSARDRRKASLLVLYFEHLKSVDESEVLVVPMNAYNLVVALLWFKARNLEIDWTEGQLTALQTPNGLQRVKIPEADRTSPLPECREECTNNEPPPDIQLLGATAFGHLFASEEVVEAFAIRLGDCQGFLGASLEGITEGEGNPRMLIV
jgi:hypothetical protein